MKRVLILIIIIMMFSLQVYGEEPSGWAEESIENLQDLDMLEEDFFKNYQELITREEFAYLAVRLFEVLDEKEITVDETISFKDTDDIYALKAASVDISSGVGNQMFAPDAFITREQLAVMMIKTLNLGKLDLSVSLKEAFEDFDSFSSWSKDAIQIAYANDVISGTGGGNFSPAGYATKEQALVIVQNILKNYQGQAFNYKKKSSNPLLLTLEDRNDSSNKAAFVKVYHDNKYLGYTDSKGQITVYNLSPGLNDFTMVFRHGKIVTSGAYARLSPANSAMWFDSSIVNSNNNVSIKTVVEDKIKLDTIQVSDDKQVKILYDDSVPSDVQNYVDELLEDVRPIINNLLGAPYKNHTYTLKYDPDKHLGYNNGKTISTFSKLPNLLGKTDPEFDKWIVNEYVHQYLKDHGIPISGSRSNESRAQAISDIVMTIASEQGLRASEQHNLDYYLNLYDILWPLGPEFILNNGPSDYSGSFQSNNFNWKATSYNKVNALGLEHHKALWITLFNRRYEESGKYDFFVEFLKVMNTGEVDSLKKFYDLMDTLIKEVDGQKTSEWLKLAPEFAGKINQDYSVKLLIIKGMHMNIEGIDNPDYIYPLLIKRSPGELVEDDCRIVITKNGKSIYDKEFRTLVGYGDLSGSLKVSSLDLDDGLYEVIVSWDVNGKTYSESGMFQVGDLVLSSDLLKNIDFDNPIRVTYTDSVPTNVRDYIDELVEIIDPIYRLYVGKPNEEGTLLIGYDPDGFAGMVGKYEMLNIKRLPDTKGVDGNFDSFFFIEYFHMFHKGRDLPFEEGRYSENISQLMKILVSDYLSSNQLRVTSSKDYEQTVNFHRYVEDLGPNILINQGVNANGGTPSRENWEMGSKYGQFINVFTLDYALSIWAELEHTRYGLSGQHDFVKLLMEALRDDQIRTKNDFYDFLDEKVGMIDGMKASQWLKTTSLFIPLKDDIYTLKLLPAKGRIMSIEGNDNPDMIYPFLVERDGPASLVDGSVEIGIYKDDTLVHQGHVTINIGSEYESYAGLNVRALELTKGTYVAKGQVTIDGKTYKTESEFIVK
ncbi:S-layer homology domain-containing protein [Acidaminobacter sp. JC074]|uniref:S-layer homology domain-containing protein n=1 Tax=Acidaminobacter sp. JC074 TaxID=2530199 RepID=UPI001F107F54|nr:S-layer homology domain-containing protein [Acidaminobacter sp. JC074]MCH4886121.1 S-layer homology domain-containing protein [Acidaminobacter sp. JC074]